LGSAGEEGGLGRSALRDLARRHGLRPTRRLGQHFLVDPNLARAIVADSGVGPGDAVLEVGPGLGSLTVALARTGCSVLAIERDPALSGALEEVLAPYGNVRVILADAMQTRWGDVLGGGRWAMVSNLPYNISVPLVLRLLQEAPAIDRYVVMVQREVADRLVAGAGEPSYGAVSVRVAYFARARVERRIPPDVFWPAPKVGSALVRIVPHPPPVDVPPGSLFRVVAEGFAERRKTMANALRRLGLDAASATKVLARLGLDPRVRAEQLGLEDLARVTRAALDQGWRP
jgi:16S rRNA (adenine1518-N6/adenine1519-N6)-dimethyltransferase